LVERIIRSHFMTAFAANRNRIQVIHWKIGQDK
jgi:hypothetical protein